MRNAVERIEKALGEEAQAEAAHILREAKEQLDRLIRDARQEEERRAEARLREDEAAMEQESLRVISRAQREARLACLESRNRVIEDIFSRVREEALSLPPERYREILGQWLQEIDPTEAGEILPAPRDAKSLAGLIAEANAVRNAGSQLTVSRENAQLLSGFIFRTLRYEVTKSLEAWLEEQKQAMAPQLGKDLSGEVNHARND